MSNNNYEDYNIFKKLLYKPLKKTEEFGEFAKSAGIVGVIYFLIKKLFSNNKKDE